MDAKQTGAFIAALRKEQGLTQRALAEKLHVSDKAISRWETGRGFPETVLLKSLSDTLGVSVGELLSGERMEDVRVREQTDTVIVQSLKKSEQRATFSTAMILLAAVILFLCILVMVFPTAEPSALQFINNGPIYMLYDLGDDNVSTHTEYDKLKYREFEGGYEYYTPDGTERYVFTHVPEFSDAPVMSYMHFSGEGTIFGISIGEETITKSNPALGTEGYNLMEYLKEQGFQREYEPLLYGRRSLVYIDGERCNWYFYRKDNVFIHLLISAYEGSRIYGYDIGLVDDNLAALLQAESGDYLLTVDDPCNVTKYADGVYHGGQSVTLEAFSSSAYDALYLYINGVCVDKFTHNDDTLYPLCVTLTMPYEDTTVLVSPLPPEYH